MSVKGAIEQKFQCEANFYGLRPLDIETRGRQGDTMLKAIAPEILIRSDESLCCKPSDTAGSYKWFAYQKKNIFEGEIKMQGGQGCAAVGGTPAYFSFLSLLMTILFR